MLRNTPIDLDQLKAHPELPQKIPDVKITPVGCHGFQTPSGKFELESTIIANLDVPGLDALPTYIPSTDDVDPKAFPMILSTGIRIPKAVSIPGSTIVQTPGPYGLKPWRI